MIPLALIFTVIISLILLIFLAVIDLKTRLLPNVYVFPFGGLGLIFYALNDFTLESPEQIALGMLAGGGSLLIIRTISNSIYKKDTLGLGDVKLMAAAGIWLGLSHIFLALSLGAFFGVLHGLLHAFYFNKNLAKLSIPAGPGFIAGIILTFLIKIFWT